MRILLTNDDGFESKGLKTLDKVLCSYGHRVSVIAPFSQKSATSHAVTLTKEIEIGSYGKSHYYCSGTPSDCLLYGFKSGLLKTEDFDLVISGINEGANTSSDILYSGTLGVASEAVMHGLKAMALSCCSDRAKENDRNFSFEEGAIFLAEHLEEFLPLCTENSIVNVNVPPSPEGYWAAADIGFLNYHENAHILGGSIENLKEEVGAKIKVGLRSSGVGPTLNSSFLTGYTDFEALNERKISVSVLNVLSTLSPLQEQLKTLEGGR